MQTEKAAAWIAPGRTTSKGTHYLLEGLPDDPLVVCIHGIGSYHFHFDELAKALIKNRFRVLRYDLIGRGFSKPSDTYDRDAHLQQIDDLFQETGLAGKRHHVVGHSMGGALALLHADRHPDTVLSLTLLSPAGLMSGGIFRILRSCSCLHGKISQALKRGQEDAWRQDFYGKDAAGAAAREAALAPLRRMHAHNPHAHEAFFKSVLQFPLSGLRPEAARAAARPGRVLVMWGAHDKGVPLSNLARWKAALGAPGAKAQLETEVVEAAAHGFFIERAEPTNARILRFLAAAAPAAGSVG